MLFFILISFFIFKADALYISGRNMILNDGNLIPKVAFGTYVIKGEIGKMRNAILSAFEAGYRHFDTSPSYLTEPILGSAIKNVTKRGIVTRKDIFITSKFDDFDSPEEVMSGIKGSLERLQLEYLDLYLIHFPTNGITGEDFDIVGIWKEMEKAKRMGLVKSIGVANFNSTHINRILTHGTIRPAVNQIEVNPTLTNLDLVAYCQQENIVVIGYGSHGFTVPRPFRDVSPPPKFNDTTLVQLAKKYSKTPDQIILRYLVDRQIIALSGSLNRSHIQENVDVFDFNISQEDIYIINEFNKNIPVYVYTSKEADALLEYSYGVDLKGYYDLLGVKY